MITIAGHRYGRADEIAAALGTDVTPQRVRDWARRGLVDRHHTPGRGRGTTWYRLDQAAAAEHLTRTSTRGRARSLDAASPAA